MNILKRSAQNVPAGGMTTASASSACAAKVGSNSASQDGVTDTGKPCRLLYLPTGTSELLTRLSVVTPRVSAYGFIASQQWSLRERNGSVPCFVSLCADRVGSLAKRLELVAGFTQYS